MFSDDRLDFRGAWELQRWEVLLGSIVAVAAPAILVSSRLSITFLAVLAGAWIWVRRTIVREALPELDGLAISLGALVLYALLSVLWGVDPGAAMFKISVLAGIVFASLLTMRLAWMESRPGAVRIAEGLWLGVLVAFAFYVVDAATKQAIRIWVINALHIEPEILRPPKAYHWVNNHLVSIGQAAFTRNTTPVMLMAWSSMMAALGAIRRPWNTRIAILIYVLATGAVWLSPQESSKTAWVAGTIAFAIAYASRTWAYRVILTAWVMACIAIVPLALLAHRADLHNAPWLFGTAKHRIIIWNFTAEHVLEHPFFGAGAYMTYVTGPQITAEAVTAPDEKFPRKMSRHSHSVYLQTWFELGVFGALLLTAAGWQVLRRISRLDPRLQPYGFATFCSAATLMASAYGMWQTWYMALMGLVPILFAIGGRALQSSETPSPAPPPVA